MQLVRSFAVALIVTSISLVLHLCNAPLFAPSIKGHLEHLSNGSSATVSGGSHAVVGVIDVASLALPNESVPTKAVEYVATRPFADTVFAVLSDGIMEQRLSAALSTWLRDSFHTFVFFTNVSHSRRVAVEYEGMPNVSVVFLTPPSPEVRTANWKNLPIIQHLGKTETLSFLEAKALPTTRQGQYSGRPLWFSIVDDDTYLLGPAVSFLLQNFTATLRNEDVELQHLAAMEGKRSSLYVGHRVVHCQRCRTVSKRFPFAFGGNGIFMSVALVVSLARLASTCGHLSSLPGDEQVGGCIHKHKLATLTHIAAGTETISMAFGDKAAEVLVEPFPYSFHRIKHRRWANDLHELEMQYPRKILMWQHLAQFFLVDRAAHYNTPELIFQETLNTSQVQAFLAARKGSG